MSGAPYQAAHERELSRDKQELGAQHCVRDLVDYAAERIVALEAAAELRPLPEEPGADRREFHIGRSHDFEATEEAHEDLETALAQAPGWAWEQAEDGGSIYEVRPALWREYLTDSRLLRLLEDIFDDQDFSEVSVDAISYRWDRLLAVSRDLLRSRIGAALRETLGSTGMLLVEREHEFEIVDVPEDDGEAYERDNYGRAVLVPKGGAS